MKNHQKKVSELPPFFSNEKERYGRGAGISTAPGRPGFSYRYGTYGGIASHRNQLLRWLDKAIEALTGINEIMTLDEELFILEPVQCVPHGPGGQGGLADEILLCQLAARLKHFVHELCRRGQVPDVSVWIIAVCGYNKNDPS